MDNIQEELKISAHQPVVGFEGTDEGSVFDFWIQEYGYQNIQFICSLAYNLGRVQGIRDNRARRRKTT